MKIQYWSMPMTEEEHQQKAREEDGRILKVKGLVDFLFQAIYGDMKEYSPQERCSMYVNLAIYEVMAEAGVLKIEDLRTVLQVAYRIRHPDDHHPRTYSTIEGFIK
jgi:hypothetical protein